MNRRNELQEEWSEEIIRKNCYGIAHISPRAGKTNCALKVLTKIKAKKVLILYPDSKILNSWKGDFEKFNYHNDDVVFSTYLSLNKHIDKYDIVIADEIHQMSENQLDGLKKLMKLNSRLLGLSGSISDKTLVEINQFISIGIIVNYTIEEAIKDGIIANYNIHIVECSLDNVKMSPNKKGKYLTEKQFSDNYTYVIERLQKEGKSSMFLSLARMRIIQSSVGKLNKTKQLLSKFKDRRVLIFTGLTKSANQLGELVHHSKDDNSEEFIKFAADESEFNHLSVINIGKAGINFKNLDCIIINYTSSNDEEMTQKICRCLLLEDDPNKISNIYIIVTTEPYEQKWLQKSLRMLDRTKIKKYEI